MPFLCAKNGNQVVPRYFYRPEDLNSSGLFCCPGEETLKKEKHHERTTQSVRPEIGRKENLSDVDGRRLFKGKIDPDKKPFSIVMPPPNVTGQLHMGHALDSTLQIS